MNRNGTIKKLKLTNFQIYETAEFTFTSHLNFIAAPNGSGKSTLTNALAFICLGTPKTLNKNCDLSQYIRFGAHEAVIEATFQYTKNPNREIIIKRVINTEKSLFYMDNVKVRKADVQSFLSECNINVSNMTQFLPQEKVSEFARLTPENLLVEVMNTVPDMNLSYQYNCICELESEASNLRLKLADIDVKKVGNERAVANLKSEIEKIEEKKMMEDKIMNMKLKLRWLEFNDLGIQKKRYVKEIETEEEHIKECFKMIEIHSKAIEDIKSKNEIKDMSIEYDKIKKCNDELEELGENLKGTIRDKIILREDLLRNSEKMNSRVNELKEFLYDINEIESRLDKIVIKDSSNLEYEMLFKIIEEVKKYYNEDKDFYRTIEKELNQYKTILDQKKSILENENQSLSDISEIKRENSLIEYKEENKFFNNENKNGNMNLDSINKINSIENILQTVIQKKMDQKYDQRKKELNKIEENKEIKNKFEKLEKRKLHITEFEKKRLEGLKSYNRDTYEAIHWLRSNKDIFKEEVIEPSYIHIRIKDNKYVLPVENMLSNNLLITFICKNNSDFELFTKKVKDEKRFRVNVIEQGKDKEIPRSHLSKSELNKLGFDGHVLDFIDARHEYLCLFANLGHLHNIPISFQKIDDVQVFRKYNIKKMIVCNRYLEVKRSRYNANDSITVDSKCKPKNLFSDNASEIEIKNIDKNLQELNQSRKENNEELKDILRKKNWIEEEITTLSEIEQSYKAKCDEIKETIRRKNEIMNQLKRKKNEYEQRKKDESLKIKEETIKKKIVDKDKEISLAIRKLDNELDKKSTFYLLTKISTQEKKYEILRRQITELEHIKKFKITEIENLKINLNVSRKLLEDVKHKISLMKKELRNKNNKELDKLPDKKEDLEREISSNVLSLNFLNIDSKAINEYNTRQSSLNEIKNNKRNIESKLQDKDSIISRKRKELIDKIEILICPVNKTFKSFFEKLNSDGKIEFNHEGLEAKKWKLNILVKFRENESLQILNSHRQSGGEKSVSTILFLLALQNLSNSPFKLVDEINQGMDRFNEKLVSNLLIDICKKDNSPQFFVITPKIVKGIEFGDKMKIIMIYSAEDNQVQNRYNKYVNSISSNIN